MAKKNKVKKSGKGKGAGQAAMIITLLVVGTIFIKTTVIFVFTGLLPTFVAWYVDSTPGKTIFRTVAACNLCGVIPYVAELIAGGNQGSMVVGMLTNPVIWFKMYATAGLGWVLVLGCPGMVEFMLTLINTSRIAKLESIQRRLTEEWGPEIMRTK